MEEIINHNHNNHLILFMLVRVENKPEFSIIYFNKINFLALINLIII